MKAKGGKGKLIIGLAALGLGLVLGVPQIVGGEDEAGGDFDVALPTTIEGVDDGVMPEVEGGPLLEGESPETAGPTPVRGDDASASSASSAPPRGGGLDVDLLARHGSYTGTPVLPADFWPPPDAAPEESTSSETADTPPDGSTSLPQDADPGATTGDGEETEAKEPPPPPTHHVTLVYVSERVLRAVVDGRVQGKGDVITAGRITEIRRIGIRVEGEQGSFLYALGVPTPMSLEGMEGDQAWLELQDAAAAAARDAARTPETTGAATPTETEAPLDAPPVATEVSEEPPDVPDPSASDPSAP